jgi:carbonic anhydrase
MKALTKITQGEISPDKAINLLKEGNARFIQTKQASRDLLDQVNDTSNGQFPYAVLLSCIDSRVPAELVFDQGIGDIFNVRVAGNIVNEDILGSIEYSCKVAGSKLVLVLGHSSCGAVTAACKKVELGNITHLLAKITPAVDKISATNSDMSAATIELVIEENVKMSIENIRAQSPILAEMEKAGEIKIIGGIYSVATGKVEFL